MEQRFNELPDEQRARLLPGSPIGRGTVHLSLPNDATLAAIAVETPVMRRIAAFLDWVGDDGRGLTQKGNLKLADGKALIELLGTDDQFNPTIGEQTFKTHSSTDLPGVDLTFRLALAARLARRHKGRVKRTKRGANLTDEPPVVWHNLVEAMLDIGLVDAGDDDRYGLRRWVEFLEEGAGELLVIAAKAGVPLPVEVLSHALYEGLDEAYDLAPLSDVVRRSLPDAVRHGAGTMIDRLVWLGAATREGVVVTRDQWDHTSRDGGEFALTDLGRWPRLATIGPCAHESNTIPPGDPEPPFICS